MTRWEAEIDVLKFSLSLIWVSLIWVMTQLIFITRANVSRSAWSCRSPAVIQTSEIVLITINSFLVIWGHLRSFRGIWDLSSYSGLMMGRMTSHDPKWPKMTPNELKWPQLTQNDPKWPQMTLNDPKWPQMTPNYPKWCVYVDHVLMMVTCLCWSRAYDGYFMI